MNILYVKSIIHIDLKLFSILSIIALSSLFFISCETTQSTKQIEQKKTLFEKKIDNPIITKTETDKNKEIRVGLLLPLKGKHYRIGRSLLNSIHLGLYKTKNKNIKIFVRDTSNVESITKAYYEFESLKIDVILGPVFSNKVNELKSLLISNNIPVITFSNNLDIAEKNIFITGLTLKNEIETIIDYASKKNHLEFAIIAPENIYGNNIVRYFEQKSLDKNINISTKVFYDSVAPDFYNVAKIISDYDKRKDNLIKKIDELKDINSEDAKKEIKLLKRKDTYGSLNFDSLFIAVENFSQLSLLSSTLPYYDVDPKQIQYFGTSLWNKTAIIKEPGLNNSIFVGLDKDKLTIFENLYSDFYNEVPHPISVFGFDAIGIVSSLTNQGIKINDTSITNKSGFNGLTGKFVFENNGTVNRELGLYRIKNEKITKIKY